MSRSDHLTLALALALALPLAACSGDDPQTSATSATTQATTTQASVGETSTSGVSASSTSKGTTTADVSGSGTTGGSTTASTGCDTDCTTTGGKITGCDAWDNPCPEGQKCTFDGDPGHTQCIDIAPAPKGLGDPCMLDGDTFSGLDDCGDGLLCWNADADTGVGECVAFCDGSGDPFCPLDMTASCSWCQECALGVCIPGCDPLLQDCSVGQICTSTNDSFACVQVGEDLPQGAPCEFLNSCAAGLVCVGGDNLPSCDGAGCCAAFCDLQDPTCPDADMGVVCVPWYEMPPEDFADVGVCVLPPP